MARGWSVELEGVTVSGGDQCGHGCLTRPPEGMGAPAIRTEDVTFPQRDGVRHYDDWYEARIITLENVTVGAKDCSDCGDVRQRVQEIIAAWSRKCDDVELVVWSDCETPAVNDGSIVGPYGIVGRPRVADLVWTRQGSARLTLRFDGVDHRMYVLDAFGTPGSGRECVTLTPDTQSLARCYPRCYTSGGDEAIPDELLRTNAHPNPFVGFEAADVWSDTFDTDVSGWSAYGTTGSGSWAEPGVLRMESSSNVINWTVTNGDYTPGGQFMVTARMRVVSNQAGDAEGPHVSFNFGGEQVTANVDGWNHSIDEWGTFTTTGTVPASFNPATDTGNLRLGMRFTGAGQSVVEIDSVAVEQTTSTGWTLGGRGGVTQTVETESGPTIPGRDTPPPWRGLTFGEGSGTPTVYTNGDGTPWASIDAGATPVSVYLLSSGIRTQLGMQTDQGTVWGQEFFPGEGWTKLDDTLTAPVGTTEARLLVRFNAEDIDASEGTLLGLTGAMLDATGEPFDGDTPDTPEIRYDWTGDPYQSTSEEWLVGDSGTGSSYCYDNETGSGAGPTNAVVRGMLCVSPTITLYGPLTNPTIENLTTGATIGYRGTIAAGDPPVVIDTTDGTATQGGAPRTNLLTGDTRTVMDVGLNVLRLSSYASTDSGHAEVCWRDAVLAG